MKIRAPWLCGDIQKCQKQRENDFHPGKKICH